MSIVIHFNDVKPKFPVLIPLNAFIYFIPVFWRFTEAESYSCQLEGSSNRHKLITEFYAEAEAIISSCIGFYANKVTPSSIVF